MQTAFLALVIIAYTAFGVSLFGVSIWTNMAPRTKPEQKSASARAVRGGKTAAARRDRPAAADLA
jgi:hypothetical protein